VVVPVEDTIIDVIEEPVPGDADAGIRLSGA
jgi:hypothetical protein